MQIKGRVTANAQVTETGKGTVVNFNVAENFSWKTKEGERTSKASYFNCAYWINPGIAQFLTTGTIVVVDGRGEAQPYTATSGEVKAKQVVHVDRIQILGGGNKAGAPVKDAAAAVTEPIEDLPF